MAGHPSPGDAAAGDRRTAPPRSRRRWWLRRPSGIHVTVVAFLAAVLTPIGLSLAAPPGVTAEPGRTATADRTVQEIPVERVSPTADGPDVPESDAVDVPDLDGEQLAARPTARTPASRSQPGRVASPETTDVELPVSAAARAATQAPASPPEPAEPVAAPTPMARVGDIALVVPCQPDVTAVVGFHQASGRAVSMQPLGQLLDSAFPGWEPAATSGEGHEHAVLASRGRGTDPTSAVDVALPAGSTVTAPTSGVVELVSDYALYGRHPDTTIRIVPDGVEDAVVQIFHVVDPVVAEGDRVEAGVTPLATVRVLPVKSQIDRITGDTRPHTHVEVRGA